MKNTDSPAAGVTGVAVDFGGTKIAAARLVDGRVVDSRRILTQGNASVNEQLSAMQQLLEGLQVQASDKIGVAVTGRVDHAGNWYAINAKTLSGIDNVPLKSLFEERLGKPVAVVNDVVAAGIAEARFGAGQNMVAFAYLTVSTGVGGVCVLNGEPIVSANGLAGHIGFMSSPYASELCGSGRTGTLESVASGRAIGRYASRIQQNVSDARAVFEHYRRGEIWAEEIIVRSADAIADASVNLAAALGIERVVIGGSVGLADGYCQLVRNAVTREPALFQLPVEPAALGQESVLIGALCTG